MKPIIGKKYIIARKPEKDEAKKIEIWNEAFTPFIGKAVTIRSIWAGWDRWEAVTTEEVGVNEYIYAAALNIIPEEGMKVRVWRKVLGSHQKNLIGEDFFIDSQYINSWVAPMNLEVGKVFTIRSLDLKSGQVYFEEDGVLGWPISALEYVEENNMPEKKEEKAAFAVKPAAKKIDDLPKKPIRDANGRFAKKAVVAPVEPAPVKPQFDDLREKLKEEIQEEGGNIGVATYALQFDNNKIRYQVRDVCHARLPWYVYNNPEGVKALHAVALNVNYYKKDAERREKWKAWLKWILNTSVFSRSFITKDVDEALDKGILCNIDLGINEVCGAIMAQRVHSEFPNSLDTWDDLVKQGWSPECAMIVSTFVHGEIYYPQGGGHHVFHVAMYLDEVCKFMKKGWNKDKVGPIYRNAKDIRYEVSKNISGKLYGKGMERRGVKTLNEELAVFAPGILRGKYALKPAHIQRFAALVEAELEKQAKL